MDRKRIALKITRLVYKYIYRKQKQTLGRKRKYILGALIASESPDNFKAFSLVTGNDSF